jgi:hypothetical protein
VVDPACVLKLTSEAPDNLAGNLDIHFVTVIKPN